MNSTQNEAGDSIMGTNEQDEELLMVLEKYKEDIKFLHHQIRGQELTPDEILAKEDTETNKAKAALLAWRDQHTKEAVEAASSPFGPTYEFLHSYHKDVLEELEAHLAELTAQQDGQGGNNSVAFTN